MKPLKQLEVDFYQCQSFQEAMLLAKACEMDDVMVSIHDRQGKYLQLSETCLLLLGYTGQELIGNSAYDYFHPDDFQTVLTAHAKVTIRPEVERVEYRLQKANGEYLEVYSLSRQLSGGAGNDLILVLTVKRR